MPQGVVQTPCKRARRRSEFPEAGVPTGGYSACQLSGTRLERFAQSSKLADVQSPVIPVVADLIRQHPGTISLGQGVVYYGPPPQARARIDEFFRDPDNHKYQPVHGIAPLVAALEAKLADEHHVRVGSERRIVVTAGGNMAFVNALLAVADGGDEVIVQSPYYFNQEM